MSINWSFVLNVLLLTGVIGAIVRMVKIKRQEPVVAARMQPSVGRTGLSPSSDKLDDIIAVRKVMPQVPQVSQTPQVFQGPEATQAPQTSEVMIQPSVHPVVASPSVESSEKKPVSRSTASSLVLFLLAKENRQLAGYELLQTLLAAGLRFGEGQLFHRHQHPNGQGPVLCSLATATATGVFDLQNIGAFSVHGLCLFMQPSSNKAIDAERFAIMLDTAKQLSEGLDTYMLDDERKPWSDEGLNRYYRKLGLEEEEVA
ncbi:MAG: cell division protein ZipA C-terminal FtsZ-binding domain-containing protein [Legionellaceae bacterium]